MLFNWWSIVETLTRSLMVVEVEIVGQSGLQLTHRVILLGIDILKFDAAP